MCHGRLTGRGRVVFRTAAVAGESTGAAAAAAEAVTEGAGGANGIAGDPNDSPRGTVTCTGGGMSRGGSGGTSNGAGGRLSEHSGHGSPLLTGAAAACCSSGWRSLSGLVVSDDVACCAGGGGLAGSAPATAVPTSTALRLTAPATDAPAAMSLNVKISLLRSTANHRRNAPNVPASGDVWYPRVRVHPRRRSCGQ